MQLKKWRLLLLVFLSTLILILPIRYFNWLEINELNLLDRFFQARAIEPPDERMIIVGITEADIQKYKTYPFTDELYANLLDKIRIQKPIAIGFDIVRDVPVPPGTEELNEIFQTTPNLIGAGVIGTIGDPYSHDIAFPPILKAKGQVGDVSGTVDLDGKVRRAIIYPLQNGSEKSQIPAFSLKMAYLYLKTKGIEPKASSDGWLQLKDTVFYPYRLSEGDYQILIDWRNRPIEQVSVADVMEGKIPSDIFQNKLVFIGGYSISLKDVFLTPFDDRYGVEIQAFVAGQILDSVLSGRKNIRGLQFPQDYIYLMVWASIASIALIRQKILNIVIVAIALAILITVFTYLAFVNGWLLPWAYPLAVIVIGAIVSIVCTYIQELRDAKNILELRVRERTLELSEALEELKQTQLDLISKEKLASLGMLTAGLAHEVRNPLYILDLKVQGIGKAREKIQNQMEENKFFLEGFEEFFPITITNLLRIEENVEKTFEQIEQSNIIIDSILGYARREISSPTLTDINSLITEAISAVQQIKQRELEVEIALNLDNEIGEILVIREEMRRAFINLIENAWNILIDKNELVNNFEPQIYISSEKVENSILIKIKDNGLGIAEEDRNKIFNPFFSTRKRKQGTGLGLYFVWEIIVNEHGGTISVESVEGEETEFVVKIPIREKANRY